MHIGERWRWANDEASQDRAWHELITTGVSWIHAPEMVRKVERDALSIAEGLLGRYAFRMVPA